MTPMVHTPIPQHRFSTTSTPIDVESTTISSDPTGTPSSPKFDQSKVHQASSSNHEFKAETRQLLDIFSKSLYKDTDAFVRELISNSNDSMEKQRIADIQSNNMHPLEQLRIELVTDVNERSFGIVDYGIGFTQQQLVDQIGTIATSGTKKFSQLMKQSEDSGQTLENLIGQFGVGFYSVFVVAEKVEIFTKSEDSPVGQLWTSDGQGSYIISEITSDLPFKRGTLVKCHLKEEFEKYSREQEIIDKVKKFSQFTKQPIQVNGNLVNNQAPIWTRTPKDITSTEQQEFQEYTAKTKNAYKYKLHFTTDLPLDLTALLQVPSSHQETMGSSPMTTEVHLQSRRVLIKNNCEELLPKWMRFVKGVVDCANISLNVSRETAQDSHMIDKLKDILTKRLLRHLKQELEKDDSRYNAWQREFGNFLKEGLAMSTQSGEVGVKEAIVPLLRVEASFSNNMVGLEDYVSNMKPNQKSIQVLYARNKTDAEKSPQIEIFRKNEIPVLQLQSHNDDLLFKGIENQKGLKIKAIDAGIDEVEDLVNKFEHDTTKGVPAEDLPQLLKFLKDSIGNDVSKVVASKRLFSQSCVVSGHMSSSLKDMLKMMERENQSQQEQFKTMMQQQNPVSLEVNPNHDLVVKLNAARKVDPAMAKEIAIQLWENAQVNAGVIDDPRSMLKRIEKFMDMALDQSITKSLIGK